MHPSSVAVSKHPTGVVLIIFFVINLVFITYVVDLEQFDDCKRRSFSISGLAIPENG